MQGGLIVGGYEMIKTRVLLVSDDPEAGRVWTYALGQRDVQVVLLGSAKDALARWAEEAFDLVIIDVYTPQLDGIDLCRRLRAEAIAPILLFTPRGDETHILQAYQVGADECIVKPISPPLFLAKVRAWLRQAWTVSAEALDSLQAGELQLDPARRQVVTATGCAVKLTNLEFRILHLLMSHQGHVLESDTIVGRVWGYSGMGESALLKNVIYRLRRKIEPEPSQPRYIQTVAGVGYAFQFG
jgi:two-component system response regulator RegX3